MWAAIAAWLVRFFGSAGAKVLSIFAPHIIAAASRFLAKGAAFLWEKFRAPFKKKEEEKKVEELIKQEQNAKTKEEQENASKNIIDHANGD